MRQKEAGGRRQEAGGRRPGSGQSQGASAGGRDMVNYLLALMNWTHQHVAVVLKVLPGDRSSAEVQEEKIIHHKKKQTQDNTERKPPQPLSGGEPGTMRQLASLWKPTGPG
ncbi:hypothetical protein EYF80_058639 [Liparis tanakae]|uniref:Uncharacterized protein n=1 Tax=Liparis tanakae TaxID=230148 RepID=A0A4Z2EQX2_9TELE|nr:hypothetical protein EYF80_058639 [Liparis tanakae]